MDKILDVLQAGWRAANQAGSWRTAKAKARLCNQARRRATTRRSAATTLFVPIVPHTRAESAAARKLVQEGAASTWADGSFRITVDRKPFWSSGAGIRI